MHMVTALKLPLYHSVTNCHEVERAARSLDFGKDFLRTAFPALQLFISFRLQRWVEVQQNQLHSPQDQEVSLTMISLKIKPCLPTVYSFL